MKIELKYGAKIGAGDTRRYLEAAGFPEGEPLGAMSLAQNENVNLHHKWGEE